MASEVKRYYHDWRRQTTIEQADGDWIRVDDFDRIVNEMTESEAAKLGHIEDLELKVCRLESELETARKVIQKLREQRDWVRKQWSGVRNPTSGERRDFDKEIEAIERGEE